MISHGSPRSPLPKYMRDCNCMLSTAANLHAHRAIAWCGGVVELGIVVAVFQIGESFAKYALGLRSPKWWTSYIFVLVDWFFWRFRGP
jgi:hypothetical protein